MSVIITLLFVVSVAANVWLLKRRHSAPARRSAYSTLMLGIENIRELATVRQNFQSIVMFEDSKALLGIPLPGTGRKFILKYSGTAVWGNDLSRIRIAERFAVNRIRIFVPYGRLLDLYADMESVKVYDQRAGLFTSIRLEEQNQEIAHNLEEVRKEALSGDLLRRANENTRLLLSSLAASMGLEAEVVFEGDGEEWTEPAAEALQGNVCGKMENEDMENEDIKNEDAEDAKTEVREKLTPAFSLPETPVESGLTTAKNSDGGI